MHKDAALIAQHRRPALLTALAILVRALWMSLLVWSRDRRAAARAVVIATMATPIPATTAATTATPSLAEAAALPAALIAVAIPRPVHAVLLLRARGPGVRVGPHALGCRKPRESHEYRRQWPLKRTKCVNPQHPTRPDMNGGQSEPVDCGSPARPIEEGRKSPGRRSSVPHFGVCANSGHQTFDK